MLLHAGPSFLLAPPPRFAAAPSSASPRRSRTPQSSPPTSHFARPADPVAQRVRPVAPRPPMATAEEGASSDVGVAVAESAQGFLLDARAYWVTKSLIAWNISDQKTSLFLYASRNATMCMSSQDMKGYDSKVELQPENDGLPSSVTQKFPFISSYRAFRIPSSVDVATLVKCQLAVASFDAHGNRQDVTGLQLPGVLDDMFAYTGPLGTIFSEEAVSMYLWAPTAQDVSVSFYDGPAGPLLETVQLNELNGVWSVTGPRNWENRYYLYEVTVYHQTTGNIEKCLAADPYARGLSANSTRTWLVDINNETLKPLAWDGLAAEKPRLDSFSDISIYELHIRDFSAHDSTVDCPFRGGFCAFTFQDSVGIEHLKKLSDAGLTHVHLLPSFQFGGVDDIKSNWKCVDEIELSKLPPGSDLQQAAIVAIQEEDPYNWGYNPVVWGVPKGSYASNPDGPSRIIEYRLMVQALNRLGLRVVMDVVYNHLYSSGPFAITSVLDKIVPGYYLRRDSNGQTENSAAVNNTASEHFMVDRLIVDDLLNWAVNYKVDGFRFDLMGHIMKKTMIRAKSALQSLTIDEHGVDGSKIYLYGEGWNFGEVAENQRGINGSQLNMSGTGIGSFNDRIRDAINGGSPFGNPLQQGFSTGLFLEPNGFYQGNETETRLTLATYADHIQIGLAGNLKDYVVISHTGEARKGSEIRTFDGSPVGYASSPIETINYASAHDNETLFDIISLKTPMDLSIDERCRINHLSTSMIALSQGIPFFHAGDEILRSKSLDRDSYDSGDWFNKIDFTYETNNWGVGLPPREKNEGSWPLMKPRLENPSFKPAKHDIIAALDKFIDILKIRYSSPLFRLTTASDIVQRVHFHNTGPSLVPGVIVMSIEDARNDRHDMAQIDETFSCVVTVFNVCPYEVSIEIPDLASLRLQLHPVQVNSSDALARQSAYDTATGRFTVPKRTAAVFVEPRC
ncbi:pullulanase-type starch debranching enzyme 1 [Zea mays]|uniref:Pullulanase-type starch debranching enzyme n=2 Tax=Zea mays TaxID=4577 RepID=O81638_MAIZE|nr:pullulanase-type starch debranching enzyme 1 [Zea mays]AAD11599.1 pullulanase-type starch debranching enzyme [Zea mays]AKO22325.1 pullulanase-type starch debranching enzyme [Zea mays]ONM18915.1 pullulanase-type starch debranching enzyme1 [Zea mays]|eukprot:NP_001104920.1 pullulanase-type starch debranching enzyme 1 [Zea mays]